MDTKKSNQADLADIWWDKFENWYETHPVTRVLIVIDAILIAFIYKYTFIYFIRKLNTLF